MSNRKLWTMKDGTKIRIKDMTDSHLMNSIKMLRRYTEHLRQEALCHYPNFNGEMAQYCAEQEWDRLNDTDADELAEEDIPIYKDLVEEAERRRLAI